MTLTLELVAAGATSTQLPEIPVPQLPGVKIYVDNPDLRSRADTDNLVSLRREKWSVIPNQSGQVTLPEVVVKWWDTGADVERRAVLPAQVLQVEGAPGSQPAEPAVAGTASENAAVTESSSVAAIDAAVEDSQPDSQTGNSGSSALLNGVNVLNPSGSDNAAGNPVQNRSSQLWFPLALFALFAWLATLFAWWWTARSSKTRSADRSHTDAQSGSAGAEQRAFKKMRSLSRGQDATAYGGAVLEWAQSKWLTEPVHNLPEVGVRLGSRQLSDDMRYLDKLRFSPQRITGDAVSLDAIQKQIEAALRNSVNDTGVQSPHALPQL